MTIGQRIFYLLEEKNMTQKEFSDRTGIATTTISDWRKKNTNPGSDKVMLICAALGVTPEYLLSGVSEDSDRGRNMDYMVLPMGTEERELVELYSGMDWLDRKHLMEYAKRISCESSYGQELKAENPQMEKIAEFCDVEVFVDSDFEGEPFVELNYIDDNVRGKISLNDGLVCGQFSKYVYPVIKAWYEDNKNLLIEMWEKKQLLSIPEWG